MGTTLTGRVALVTGGARGQGRSHAIAMAREGATVVVCDIAAQLESVPYPMATPADLDETVALIKEAGGQGSGHVVDIRDARAVEALVDAIVAEHGHLDILVANAGITTQAQVEDISDLAWTEMIDTNLTGTFNCLRAVLPTMKRQSYGRIVTISSGAGRGGMANLGHYVATKWAVIGLTKTIALEQARAGITANVVCPTTVATPMVQHESTYHLFLPDVPNPTQEQILERFRQMSPMRIPWVEPEEISRAVMYLVTDAGYTTGTVLEVNLGTSASRT